MHVVRVFCYSKEVAKQNNNNLPIPALIITPIGFMIVMLAVIIGMTSAKLSMLACVVVTVLLTLTFIGVIAWLAVLLTMRMQARMAGWVLTDDNRILKVQATSNSGGIYVGGGMAMGGMLDHALQTGNQAGRTFGTLAGSAAEYYSMHKVAEYMSLPEVVAEIAESVPNYAGVIVTEILKVYEITAGEHSVKVRCDYRDLRTGKIKVAKNLRIEKSYDSFEDLMNLINSHR